MQRIANSSIWMVQPDRTCMIAAEPMQLRLLGSRETLRWRNPVPALGNDDELSRIGRTDLGSMKNPLPYGLAMATQERGITWRSPT
jgi:hypothetical protein